MIAILQRDARLVDFLMEDISGYADDQIGAAVRELHDQCRDSLARYITLEPVIIDGVEGTFAKGALERSEPGEVRRQRGRPNRRRAARCGTKAGARRKSICPC